MDVRAEEEERVERGDRDEVEDDQEKVYYATLPIYPHHRYEHPGKARFLQMKTESPGLESNAKGGEVMQRPRWGTTRVRKRDDFGGEWRWPVFERTCSVC